MRMRGRKHIKWTKEEEDLLIKNFYSMKTKDLLKLFPNKSEAAIMGKANYIGLNQKSNIERKRWKVDERNYIKENASNLTMKELQEKFPHFSSRSIERQCIKQGVDYKKVLNVWTKAEDKLLLERYSTSEDYELKVLFPNRDLENIKSRAERFDLKRTGAWSSEDIVKLKNISSNATKKVLENTFPSKSYEEIMAKLKTVRDQLEFERITHFNWSREEDMILLENFGYRSMVELERILPSKTKASIESRMFKLGLLNDLPWSKEEDDVLKEYYTKIEDLKDLEILLPHRTSKTIKARSKSLGLKREKSELENVDISLVDSVKPRYSNFLTKNVKKYWTRDEEKLLTALYPIFSSEGLQEKFPFHSKEEVESKAKELKLIKGTEGSEREWSLKDITLLKERLTKGVDDPQELRLFLPNHSIKGIEKKIKQIKTKRGFDSKWTEEELRILRESSKSDTPDELMKKLPEKTWVQIYNQAVKEGLYF